MKSQMSNNQTAAGFGYRPSNSDTWLPSRCRSDRQLLLTMNNLKFGIEMIFDLPSSSDSDSDTDSFPDMAIPFRTLFEPENEDPSQELPESEWILREDFWHSALFSSDSDNSSNASDESLLGFSMDYDNQIPYSSLEEMQRQNAQLIRFTRQLHEEVEELINAGVRIPDTNTRAFFQQLAEDILEARHEILAHRLTMLNSGVVTRDTDALLMDYFLESAQASVLAARFHRQEQEDAANNVSEATTEVDEEDEGGLRDIPENMVDATTPHVSDEEAEVIKSTFEAFLIFLALFCLGILLDLLFRASFRKV